MEHAADAVGLPGARGVQVGDNNRQVNQFIETYIDNRGARSEPERRSSVRAIATWLEAFRHALITPPPWAVDAPPDIPRSLTGKLSPRFSVVVGGSGEGKSRWLARAAANQAQRLLDQPMSAITGPEATLPMHASAHAFMSRLRRLAAQTDDADPWQALVMEATQCVVGRMPSAELADLRQAILEHIYRGQPVCVLLDALDELPAADVRELSRPDGKLGIWLEHPSTQLILTARDREDLLKAFTWAKPSVIRLRQISRRERNAHWAAWRGSTASGLIARVRHDTVLDQLLGNPFLAALAIASPEQSITRASLLRSAMPRLLRSEWRDRPRGEDDELSVHSRARYAREIAWRMATEEPQWNSTWPVTGIYDILAQLIHPRGDVKTIDELDARDRELVAHEAAALSALLPSLSRPGADSAAFVHAQLQHFLIAWKLSDDAAGAIAFLRPRWWSNEDWQDVTVLLAGLLPDPAPLLRALDDDGITDPFGLVDRLAVRALAETRRPRPAPLHAVRRVQAMLAAPNRELQASCAAALACLGGEGFAGVSWEVLAPWSGSGKEAGHTPNVAFSAALRVSAPAADHVVTRMADGHPRFASWNLPSALSEVGMETDDSDILRSQPDWIVLGLAKAQPEGWHGPGAAAYALVRIAATEAHLRELPFDDKYFPPDIAVLVKADRFDRAAMAMAQSVRREEPNAYAFSRLSINVQNGLKHMTGVQLRDIAVDSDLPVRLREESLLVLIDRDLELALTAATFLTPHLMATSNVFIKLAESADGEPLARTPLTVAASSRLESAEALFRLDHDAGLEVYQTLYEKALDGADDPCPHDVLHSIGRNLQTHAPALWLDAVIRWTPCMKTDVDDCDDLGPAIANADQDIRRMIAISAASSNVRRLAVQTLPAAANREVLRQVARESGGRLSRAALEQLGLDEFAVDYLTGVVADHLAHCPGFDHDSFYECTTQLSWLWKLPAAARIPAEVMRQWLSHTDDLMVAAVAGDAAALTEIRRRRDVCQATRGKSRWEDRLRKTLIALAKTGDSAALSELEQETIRSFTTDRSTAWAHALAAASPDRARAVLDDATRGKPADLWIVQTLADLDHYPSAQQLIRHFVAHRDGKLRLSATPPYWIERTHPDVAAAAFRTYLRAICERMSSSDDLDDMAAPVELVIRRYGKLLRSQDVSLLRTCLKARADHIREVLTASETAK